MVALDNRGRDKGSPKVGGATVGSVKTQSVAVKDAVLKIFHEVNSDGSYLREIAADDRKLFLSLLARLIPTEVAIEQKVTFDIGSAMREATARVDRMTAEQIENTPTPIVDVTPEPPTPAAKPQPPLTDPRVLPAEDQVAVADPDRWPGYE